MSFDPKSFVKADICEKKKKKTFVGIFVNFIFFSHFKHYCDSKSAHKLIPVEKLDVKKLLRKLGKSLDLN